MSTLLENQFIFSANLSLLLQYLRENKFKWSMGESYRTKEQAELYAKKGLGIVDSQHCKRLAQDIFLFTYNLKDGRLEMINDKSYYKPLGNYWAGLDIRNRWGGNFTNRNDPYHFEMQED